MADGSSLHTGSSPPQFDRVAHVYRWAEYAALGPLLQRTRTRWIREITWATQALVLGDGDGRFLAALLRHSPHLHATAIDTSTTMLHLLRRRCAFAAQRLHTIQGSGTVLASELDLSRTDLVISHFLLDCLSQDQAEELIQTLAAKLPAGAEWLISDFGVPRSQPWRALGRVYVRALYAAFRLLTGLRIRSLPVLEGPLECAGFARVHRAQWLKGLLYSEVWRLRAQSGVQRPKEPGATQPLSPPSTLE